MKDLLTWQNILLVIGALSGVAVWAYRTFSKQTPQAKLDRLIWVQNLAQSAYMAVHSISANTSTTVDDKVAEALKKVAEIVSQQTGQPLTLAEKSAAIMQAQATATKLSLPR